ncbi:ParB/RepB/Spo0J family partition protein [Actinoplanes utahensis]|uniref:ParB/RepB/Spo0J family partition protein n=1 Tax=Actinoplanes utahensis TaxID=1869 RepID=UPI001377B887|nr:ParB/RepB/Spo0J family partition protein [Actinoplanes utahensis]
MAPTISSQIFSVPIDELVDADPLRANGVDPEHARLLAQVAGELPPILVNKATMSVIDGMHRLRAAQLNGVSTLAVRFFQGSDADALQLAVSANVTHGLPLSLADRRAAVRRLIRAEPRLADRAVATIAGLAPATVAAIRADVQDGAEITERIGRDGRVRPLSTAEGRRVAGEVIARQPQTPLREVARAAGISVGTARDVRSRVRAGRDPVPAGQAARSGRLVNRPARAVTGYPPATAVPADTGVLLEGLRRDPSLRYSEAGRHFLQFLGTRVVEPGQLREAARELPPHCAIVVARIARECARTWMGMAEALDREAEHAGRG